MDQDEIFRSLAKNGFDFLARGIAEFDTTPKYSVIHFCAAVEMLLKARLMKEHWALIVSKPEQAKIDQFMAGRFISVTLEEARTRLKNISDVEIPEEAYSSFQSLANHRNRMIHFFHSGLEKDEKAKSQIVAEHCRSWFHLHRLLVRWTDAFQEFQGEIRKADQAMKTHRKYLKAKFEALKPELETARKGGNTPERCSSCGFKSAVPHPFDDEIANFRCLVCDHSEVQVTIDCPHCQQPVVLIDEGFADCPHCAKGIDPDNVASSLSDDLSARYASVQGDDSWDRGNCSLCDGHQTVVRRATKYFCASCFEIFPYVETCGWCGELNTGDMTDSGLTGCNFCDGHPEWCTDD